VFPSEEAVGGTSERGLSRPAKAVLAAVLLGGLLAVVALAARGRHPGGHATVQQREVPTWLQNDLFTLLLVVYALGIVVLIAAFLLVRKNWEEPPSQRRLLRNLVMAVIVVGALALLAHHRLSAQHGKGLKHQPRSTAVTPGGQNRTVTSSTASGRRAEIDWVLAGAVGGALLLTALVVFARRRRADEEQETVEEELAAVVSDAIDDLRNEADPRRAVIAAYARMEGVLGQHGFARHRSEAPHEYLGRVLTRLRVRRGAVEELTELFERAKFSTHEIDQQMKERAIAGLVSVREDLQRAAA
jgi:Domain of unknown function (DUF4129)